MIDAKSRLAMRFEKILKRLATMIFAEMKVNQVIKN